MPDVQDFRAVLEEVSAEGEHQAVGEADLERGGGEQLASGAGDAGFGGVGLGEVGGAVPGIPAEENGLPTGVGWGWGGSGRFGLPGDGEAMVEAEEALAAFGELDGLEGGIVGRGDKGPGEGRWQVGFVGAVPGFGAGIDEEQPCAESG